MPSLSDELLREDPLFVPAAVDELLRYDSSVQIANRTAARDCELAGTPVHQWETVTLVLGAANRDPKRFAEPDRVDIARPASRHVGFGLGPHFCLGAALTRLEATVALARWCAAARSSRWLCPPWSTGPTTGYAGSSRCPFSSAG